MAETSDALLKKIHVFILLIQLLQIKAKQEAARRTGGKLILEKLRPESPLSRTKLRKKSSLKKIRDGLVMKKVHSSSFDPVPIVESEEMERQHQLKQREFLVRSYGLIEQVNYCFFPRKKIITIQQL